MSVTLTDSEISVLLEERKMLPADFQKRIERLVSRFGHQRADVDFTGVSGSRYCIMVRQNTLNHLDFSAILGYYLPKTTSIFRLKRYNGKHRHMNRIEGEVLHGFHIHEATERYQRLGAREDAYAVLTDRFNTLTQALRCLRLDNNCEIKGEDTNQQGLFGDDSGAI